MRKIDWVLLITLAAIWGSSFLFMRILSPVFGPVLTTFFRVGFATMVLTVWLKLLKVNVGFQKNWKIYSLAGVVNTAIPFSLFAFSVRHIPASWSVVLNATAPLFGVLVGTWMLNEKFTLYRFFGVLAGILGVYVLKGGQAETNLGPLWILAVLACLVASACYAFVGGILKSRAKDIPGSALAWGSHFFGSLTLLPFAATGVGGEVTLWESWSMLTPKLGFAIFMISSFCSATALMIYYPLMKRVGPTRSLTVTFLMPVFGVIWANLFLGEVLTSRLLGGAGIILIGTYFVLKKKKPKNYSEAQILWMMHQRRAA